MGTVASDTVTISNAAPVIASLSVAPQSVYPQANPANVCIRPDGDPRILYL